MHVTELNRNQLNELKQAYATQLYDCGEYEEVTGISYGELVDSVTIPDDVIFNHYNDIDFVEEDFWCNVA